MNNTRTVIPLILGVAVITLVIGVALGSIVLPMTKTMTETRTETATALDTARTTTTTTVEVISTTAFLTSTVVSSSSSYSSSSSSIESVNYTRFISLWQALSLAFGGDNYSKTSLPAYLTSARLTLYAYFTSPSGGNATTKSIPWDNQTGLPTQQQELTAYPNGPVSVGGDGASCLHYFYFWVFAYNTGYPWAPSELLFVNAITGQVIGDPISFQLGLSC